MTSLTVTLSEKKVREELYEAIIFGAQEFDRQSSNKSPYEADLRAKWRKHHLIQTQPTIEHIIKYLTQEGILE